MTSSFKLILGSGILWGFRAFSFSASTTLSTSVPAMGTVFQIELRDAAVEALESSSAPQVMVSQIAQKTLTKIEGSLSDWSESSELRRLESMGLGRFQQASELFIKMLSLSLEASEQSAGVFDITVGDTLWLGLPSTQGTLKNLQIKNDRFRFVRPPKRLTFGGIAKGYAVGQVFDEVSKLGFAVARVDGGGGNAVVDKRWLALNRPDIQIDSDRVILAFSRTLQGPGQNRHIINPLSSKALAADRQIAIACRYPSRFDKKRTLAEASALVDASTKALIVNLKQNTAMKILDCIDIMPQWPAKAPQTQPSQ